MSGSGFLAGTPCTGIAGITFPPLWRPVTGAASAIPICFNASVFLVKRMPALTVRLIGIVVSAMSQSVLHVFFLSTPGKIIALVIFPVSVKVASNKTVEPGTGKCLKDKLVDKSRFNTVVFRRINHQVPIFANLILQNPLRHSSNAEIGGCGSGKRLHPTKVGHFIKSFISSNGTPFFKHAVDYTENVQCHV